MPYEVCYRALLSISVVEGLKPHTSHDQCFPFPGIGPAAESNPATIRIKYGINPGISGICPIPAAESKVGYIPLSGGGAQLWLDRASSFAPNPCRKPPNPAWASRTSAYSDLVQCTLNGSAQRPSPEEHRARPAASGVQAAAAGGGDAAPAGSAGQTGLLGVIKQSKSQKNQTIKYHL